MRFPRLFRRRRPQQLACVEFVELVTDYLEGALSDDDQRRLEAHLEQCDGCDRYLDQIREMIALTRLLTVTDVETLAPTTRVSLMAAFREFRAASP